MTTTYRPPGLDYRTCPMSNHNFVNRLTSIEENDPAIKVLSSFFVFHGNRPMQVAADSHLFHVIQRWHGIAMHCGLGGHPLGDHKCSIGGYHRVCYSSVDATSWIDTRLLNYTPDSMGRVHVFGKLVVTKSLHHACSNEWSGTCPMLTNGSVNCLTPIEAKIPDILSLFSSFGASGSCPVKVIPGSELLDKIQLWDSIAMHFGLGGHPIGYTECSIVGHHRVCYSSSNATSWVDTRLFEGREF
ncbi:hypothetical protein HDU98_004871 [Podochytrium sp. JEL0797]|nr:hypothetical protein HDU98_004871 [Podochytrium sp. JEL0797]